MKVYLSDNELKIIREALDYDDLHLKKLAEWEESYDAPQLQCNIIKYLSKKSLARRVDLIICLKDGENDLTCEQCCALAHVLESKLERDVRATHKLYRRDDAKRTLSDIAKEEIIPTFMLLDKFRDY